MMGDHTYVKEKKEEKKLFTDNLMWVYHIVWDKSLTWI